MITQTIKNDKKEIEAYIHEIKDERIDWIISKLERASDTNIDIVCQFVRGLCQEC